LGGEIATPLPNPGYAPGTSISEYSSWTLTDNLLAFNCIS